jgi:hypothetical protein
MAKHKWHKEIKAWAEGGDVQFNVGGDWHDWRYNFEPHWDVKEYKFRIKPQPQAKCIVKDCMNHTNEGKFVGELCAPCWDYITNGNGVHSQAYRNAQPKDEKPKYLYVYKMMTNHGLEIQFWDSKTYTDERYLGKIKLEVDDVGSA